MANNLKFYIFFLIVLLSLNSINSLEYWTNDLNNGLYAYYNFNSTGASTFGEKVEGYPNFTFNNTPAFYSGIKGQAVNFDGINDFATCKYEVKFDTNATSDFTINTWINFSSVGTNYQGIIYMGEALGTGQRISIAIQGGNFVVLRNGAWDTSSITPIVDKTYHMYTFIRKNNGLNFSIWIDGKDTNWSVATITSDIRGQGFIQLGFHNNYINASFDEFGFWNRSLNSSQLNTLYNGGLSIGYKEYAPVLLSVLFNYQDLSDLDSQNSVARLLNITYNITSSGNILNLSSIKLYYKSNSTIDDTTYYINGVSYSSYLLKNYSSNASSVFKWLLEDNDIYPAVYNVNDNLTDDTIHSNFTLNSNTDLLKVRFYNISNNKLYSFLEIMTQSTDGLLQSSVFYYCNSSYSSGKPSLNVNCGQIYNLLASQEFNHSHSINSRHMVIPFTINVTTGMLGSVVVTSLSYIIQSGSLGVGDWITQYIPYNVNSVDYSTTTGISYLNLNGTIDAHIHQFGLNTSLFYYVCGSENGLSEVCASVRSDLFQLSNMPPSISFIYNPISSYYKGNLTINWSQSISPNNYPITYKNLSLYYSNETFKSLIVENLTSLSYILNTSSIPDNSYKLFIKSCDNNSLCTSSFSSSFTIDNTYPLISFSSLNPIDYKNHSSSTLNISLNLLEINIASVIYTLKGNNYNSIVTNTDYSYSFIEVPDGVYIYNVSITDLTGNINYTATRNILIDTYKPSAVYSSPSGVVVNNTNVTFIVNISDISFYYRYQEYGNSSYSYNINTPSNCEDGDYLTRCFSLNGSEAYYYVNYTIPSLAIQNYTLWSVKGGYPLTIQNLTIPLDCWNISNELVFKIIVYQGNINFTCFNGSSYKLVYSSTDFLGGYLYEESVIFKGDRLYNVSGISNTTITIRDIDNNTINETNISSFTSIYDTLISYPVVLSNGLYNWFVTIYDYAQNVFISSIYYFTVNDGTLSINITYPRNLTYLSNITYFSYIISGDYVDCYYSKDNIFNITFNCSLLTFPFASTDGNNTLSLYSVNSLNQTKKDKVNYFIGCINSNADVIIEDFPYITVNKTYTLQVDGFPLNLSTIKINISDTNGSSNLYLMDYNAVNQTYFKTFSFSNIDNYRIFIYGDEICPSLRENITLNLYSRNVVYLIVRGFNNKTGSLFSSNKYINEFAYVTIEYPSKKYYDSTLEKYIMPLGFKYSFDTPVYYAPYRNGQATIKVYDTNTSYHMRLFDGDIKFDSNYDAPNISKSYGTNIYLGQVVLNGTNKTLDILLTNDDIYPYSKLINWATAGLIALIFMISLMLLLFFPNTPAFSLIFGMLFSFIIIFIRVVLWVFGY